MQLPCLSPVAISFPRAEHGVVIRSGFHSGPVNFQQTQETHHIPYELKVWLKCITGIGQISYLHNVLIHVYRNLATMTLLYHWYNFHSNLEYSNLLMTWERGAWVHSPVVVSCVCVWTPSWPGDCVKNRAIDFSPSGLVVPVLAYAASRLLCLRGSSLNRNTCGLVETKVNISAGNQLRVPGCAPFVTAAWVWSCLQQGCFKGARLVKWGKGATRRHIWKQQLALLYVIKAWIIPIKEDRAVEMVLDIVKSLWLTNAGLFELWVSFGIIDYYDIIMAYYAILVHKHCKWSERYSRQASVVLGKWHRYT